MPNPEPALTPQGQLHLRRSATAPPLAADLAARITQAFKTSAAAGLLHLGAAEIATALPQPWAWWRDVGALLPTKLCRQPAAEADAPLDIPIPRDELTTLVLRAPPMHGGEYLDVDQLADLWPAMLRTLTTIAPHGPGGPQKWLADQHPSWHAVGRVHLHLAEHKADPARPFAFLATYTTRLSASARPQHVPLGRAVQQAAVSGDKRELLALLEPVQRAAQQSPWLADKVAAGELYNPTRWTARQAFELLQQVPVLEAAGVSVRTPAHWKGRSPARVQVTATVGENNQSAIGVHALLDFQVHLTVAGEALTADEVQALLAGVDGLQLIRGQWVQVDRGRLEQMMAHYERAQDLADSGGLDFHTAMKLLAGGGLDGLTDLTGDTPDWSQVVAGSWLADILAELRSPTAALDLQAPKSGLKATLRPYQDAGVRWLLVLSGLGLGACLADDMGLGKTIQVLALLLVLRQQGRGGPTLMVGPATLLGNWQTEARRFTPTLRVRVAHRSAREDVVLQGRTQDDIACVDLVLTTYGTLARDEGLRNLRWRLCVLDEAQAIKNPGTRQTRAVKQLKADARIAMTGTPVENRLSDLWSLMDFLNPGLLGTNKAFAKHTQRMADSPRGYAPLRQLVQPYLLRRRKTDKAVISDLPDKTEVRAFCGLSKLQAALYAQAVKALSEQLLSADGIARRGVILAALMRFKQICNHPSQWLGDGAWKATDSGKFARLHELATTIAARGDKLLVFTQFRETIDPLQAFLQGIFGGEGLVLHGGTAIRQRTKRVKRFADDPSIGFFVLSLKAGGTGLNLTAASHVVHFDRWWNPAVEDQATDRAFRIGQQRNVLVHKLVCRGTVEERIDQLIADKRALSDEVLSGGGGESVLTELSDADLMATVALDLDAAMVHGDGCDR